MVELRGRLGFRLKALELPAIQGGGERKHFQGHPTAEGDLVGFVNHPHAAPADFAEQPIVA